MARLVPALSRGLDIVDLLAASGPMRAPELGARLELPRTTVFELLKTLEAHGYVRCDDGLTYQLSIRLLELGSAYEESIDLVAISRRVSQSVAERCQETVNVAVLDGNSAIYITKVNSTHAVRMVSAVGKRLPAHVTAVGKAMLAALTEAELDDLYADVDMERMTPDSITSLDELKRQLDLVRREGVGWDHGESTPDVDCVGAPVRDHRGEVVAAISISVPVIRWNEQRARELATLAIQGADEVSADLGYSTSASSTVSMHK